MLGGAGGLLGGIQQGGTIGDTRAALSAGQIASKLGAFGQNTGNINAGLGVGGNLLGLYTGLKNGGVGGYAGAAVNGAQLASRLGLVNSGIGAAAGYVAAPLAAYNFVNNWKSGATGSDAMNGASAGAAIGSIVPGIGTAIGAVIGGAVGALSSAFGGGAVDPESRGVQNVIDATAKAGDSTNVAASVQNPYLNLAGLFDRHDSTLPIYQQYGRMGESKFSTGLINTINTAYSSGKINKNSTPQDVYNKVVAPWVNSMGSGWSNVGSTYTSTTQGLIQDMVSQYMNGSYKTAWQSVGGDAIAKNAPAYGSGLTATTDGTWINGAASNQPSKSQLPVSLSRFGSASLSRL